MDIVDVELSSSHARLTLASQGTGPMERQWSGAKDILSLVTHGRCQGQTFFILVCDGVEGLLHLLRRLLVCLKRSCGRQLTIAELTIAEPTQPKQFLPDLLQELPRGRQTKRFGLPDLVAGASREVPEAFTRVAPVNPLVCPCHSARQAASQVEHSRGSHQRSHQRSHQPTHPPTSGDSQQLVESRMCGPTVGQVSVQDHNAPVDSDILMSYGPPDRRRPSPQVPQESEAVRSIVDMLREVGDNLDSRLREKEPTLLCSIQRQLCQEMIGPLRHTMVHVGGQTIRFLYYLTQW